MQTSLLDRPPPAPAAFERREARQRRPIWRRRYWVHWRWQLPITLLVVCVTLFFLVMFSQTLFKLTEAQREAILEAAPSVGPRVEQDKRFHLFTQVSSALVLLLVTSSVVALTNRSAGPTRRIAGAAPRPVSSGS